jgi:hypothetical protein
MAAKSVIWGYLSKEYTQLKKRSETSIMTSKPLKEMFDLDWYSTASGQAFSGVEDGLQHYLTQGAKSNISSSPYIDEAYYRARYSDVRESGVSALEHYLKFGDAEGRNPHPLFSAEWYKRTHGVRANALQHYIDSGWRSGLAPHPAFALNWYVEKYQVSADPLLHYILNGFDPYFRPNPIFDPNFVIKNLGLSQDKNVFRAYLLSRKASHTSFNDLFDMEFFSHQAGRHGYHVNHESALEAFVLSPVSVDCHPLFSRQFYRKKYMGSAEGNELEHYLRNPTCLNDPHPMFSTSHYYRQKPEARRDGVAAVVHYLTSPPEEVGEPHQLFSGSEYIEINSDVASSNINPLVHYVQHGFDEGRSFRKPHAPLLSAKRLLLPPAISQHGEMQSVAGKKIGVFAHVFYPDVIEEVIANTNLIPGDCRLYISTNSTDKVHQIVRQCAAHSQHPFEIRVTPNRGRDIAPMIVGFSDRLKGVDLALHIHSKKSKHYQSGFDAWRKYLFETNLGTTENITNIIALFSDSSVGAAAPIDYPAVQKLIQWGGNGLLVRKLLDIASKGEIVLTNEHPLELPSGSMFWFDPSALKHLLELDLDYSHFDPEQGQVDGTLAHAIERSFFYFVELAGKRWVRFKPQNQGENGLAVVSGKLLPHRSGTKPLVYSNPETRVFTAVRSEVPRPRLNLLIPTAERQIGYAGVSEGLRIFDGIADKLIQDFDIRIIGTDVPFSAQIQIPPRFTIENLNYESSTPSLTYVDGTRKAIECLPLRENDVFMATAWWTALQAKDLIDQQSEMFRRKRMPFVYLIQDYECGFYPWSTRYGLAESTYASDETSIKIVNTRILADFFSANGYFDDCIVYDPPLNSGIQSSIRPAQKRDRTVLLYMRPAAMRNCLEFADAVVYEALRRSPEFWRDWRFLAIGEDFDPLAMTRSGIIEVSGRLSLQDYGQLISTAAVGLSLMISPHPSYPPLEMAAGGMRVITNNYANKDLSKLHDNIYSFDEFEPSKVALMLEELALEAISNPPIGEPKIDWFFDGRTNVDKVVAKAASLVQSAVRLSD